MSLLMRRLFLPSAACSLMFTWLLYAATEYVEWVPNSGLNRLARQHTAAPDILAAHFVDILRGTECAVAAFLFLSAFGWFLSNVARLQERNL